MVAYVISVCAEDFDCKLFLAKIVLKGHKEVRYLIFDLPQVDYPVLTVHFDKIREVCRYFI